MQILELDELRVRERGDNGCLKYCEGERSALSSRGFVFSGVVASEWGQLALPTTILSHQQVAIMSQGNHKIQILSLHQRFHSFLVLLKIYLQKDQL